MARAKRICTLDAETDPFIKDQVPEPFVWGFYDGFDYDVFWGEDGVCTESMIEYISELDVDIYAHNGGKFDFFYLLPYMAKGTIKIINGRISRAKIGKATILDSYNIIPVPQAMFGKDSIDYWKMLRRHRKQHRPEILRYLQTDVVELHGIVSKFCERFGRKLTLASASMELLKTKIEYKTRRPLERFSEEQDARFRPYYYGGRTEAIQKGELRPISGQWKIFDINSAYPEAMCKHHPDPSYNSFYNCKKFPTHTNAYFAHIRAISFGALPWRSPDPKITTLGYPRDQIEREYFVTGWEIAAGLATGTLKIIEIINVIAPDKLIEFSDFVLPLYEEKKHCKLTQDLANELFAKLLLNSGYGKLALDPRKFKEFELVHYGDMPSESKNEKYPHLWDLHGTYPAYDVDVYQRPKHLPREFFDNEDDYIKLRGFYNVATAASITGCVRAKLWESICSSKNPIYCDTDSLACEEFGGEQGDELGQWKYEGAADLAYIAGRKNYAFRIVDGPGHKFWMDRQALKYGIAGVTHKKVSSGRRWKIATKGTRLNPGEIIMMVKHHKTIRWENNAPTNSLQFGTRFLSREVRMT